MPIRLVLAEDNALLRQGLVRLVEADPELTLVGPAGDKDELLAVVREQRPDVVVSDIRMPPTGTDEGVQVATLLRDELPEVGVVLLSQHADVQYALALLGLSEERDLNRRVAAVLVYLSESEGG